MTDWEFSWLETVRPKEGIGEIGRLWAVGGAETLGDGEVAAGGADWLWRRLMVIRLPVTPSPRRPPRTMAIMSSLIMDIELIIAYL